MSRSFATLLGVLALATAVPSGVEPRAQPADAPTFVGSAACGGCHEREMAAWRGSHHDLAMQEATRGDRARRLRRRELHPGRRHLALLQARRQVLRHHRRAGRRARRLRDPLHLRRLSAAAVSDRFPGRPACRRSASPGTRGPRIRAGNAGSTSTPTSSFRPAIRCIGPGSTRPGTSCAPSATRPSCARTTMRPPTATRPPGPRSTSPARPATVPAPPTSPGPSGSRAGCPGAKAAMTGSRSTSTSAKASTGRSIPQPATPRAARRGPAPRSSRPAASAIPAAPRSPKAGVPASSSSTPMCRPCCSPACSRPTARCWTRSTTTPRSARARCSRRA